MSSDEITLKVIYIMSKDMDPSESDKKNPIHENLAKMIYNSNGLDTMKKKMIFLFRSIRGCTFFSKFEKDPKTLRSLSPIARYEGLEKVRLEMINLREKAENLEKELLKKKQLIDEYKRGNTSYERNERFLKEKIVKLEETVKFVGKEALAQQIFDLTNKEKYYKKKISSLKEEIKEKLNSNMKKSSVFNTAKERKKEIITLSKNAQSFNKNLINEIIRRKFDDALLITNVMNLYINIKGKETSSNPLSRKAAIKVLLAHWDEIMKLLSDENKYYEQKFYRFGQNYAIYINQHSCEFLDVINHQQKPEFVNYINPFNFEFVSTPNVKLYNWKKELQNCKKFKFSISELQSFNKYKLKRFCNIDPQDNKEHDLNQNLDIEKKVDPLEGINFPIHQFSRPSRSGK